MNDTHEIRETLPVKHFPAQRPWTSREIAELRRVAHSGAAAIALVLGRSVSSVRLQAHRQGISLRPPGEIRGVILGQPRGTSARRDRALARIRADYFEGRLDIERMVRFMRLLAQGADICPRCAARPIEVEDAGLCRACHLRDLADHHEAQADRIAAQRRRQNAAHQAEIVVLDAQRQLDRGRQRKHREGLK